MIIITGANGFIGSAIVHDFNQKGIHDLIVVDSVSPQERPQPLSNKKYSRFLLHTELWSFLDTSEAQQNVSWIIHMGACSSTQKPMPVSL
jgi:ADP-L-glycero-D-manno-heptose 6-epimerase